MKFLLPPTPRSWTMFFHTLGWAFIGLLAAIVHPRGRLFSWIARIWGKQTVWLAGMQVCVKGLENVSPGSTYIVCANHQSLIDIPLLMARLPFLVRFLAKRSLFFIPVFGWSLYLAGFVPVHRGVSSKARRSLGRAARRIKRGPSLVIFPEGTRTEDGLLATFKSGAFTLAIRSKVPVLPVAIRGTFDVVPKTTLRVTPGPVEVIIGEPIFTSDLGMQDKTSLMNNTYAAVKKMVESGDPTGEMPKTTSAALEDSAVGEDRGGRAYSCDSM